MTAAVHRCERGGRCYHHEPDPDTGEKLGAVCDRPLCPVCEHAVYRALDEAPEMYVRLRQATLRPGSGVRSELVTGTANRPLPGDNAARNLAERLWWLVTTWEDEVRSIAGLSYPERDGKREGPQVQAACKLLAAYVPVWLSAPTTTIRTQSGNHDPDRRRHEPRPDEDVQVEQSGARAAAELLDWRSTVRNLPGVYVDAPKALRRYKQPCPACGVQAVTHRAGDDLTFCENCADTRPYMPTLPREADYRTEEGAA